MTPQISFKQSQSNFRWNAIELLFAAPFIVVMQQYVPVLIARLGASPLLLGLVTSGAALMLTFAATLAPRWMRIMRTYGRSIGVSLLIFRSIMIAIPLLLLLPRWNAEAIVLLTIALNLFGGFANMTLTSYLPRMALPDQLAQLVSVRWIALGVCMAVFTPIIAWVLDHFAQPTNYIVACAGAFVFGMIGILALQRIKPVPDTAQSKARLSTEGRSTLLAHPRARLYLLITLLVHLSINAPGPLITLQMVRELKATDSEFGWYLAIFWISLAAAGLLAPRVIRRYGNPLAFAFSTIALAGQVIILALAPNLPVTWIAGFLGGVASVFFQVSGFALVIECAPPDKYESYLSLYMTVVNFCIFAAPLFTSAIVTAGWVTIFGGLMFSAALRGMTGLLAFVLVRRQ
jgi:MFS family permease